METRVNVHLWIREENYEVSGLAEGEFSKKVVDKAVRSSFSAVLPEDPVSNFLAVENGIQLYFLMRWSR